MEDHEVRVVGERPAVVLLAHQQVHRAVRLRVGLHALRGPVAEARHVVLLAHRRGVEIAVVGQRGSHLDVEARRRELGRSSAGVALRAVDRRGRDAHECAGIVHGIRPDPQPAAHHVLESAPERVLERGRARREVVADEAVVRDGDAHQVVVGDADRVPDRIRLRRLNRDGVGRAAKVVAVGGGRRDRRQRRESGERRGQQRRPGLRPHARGGDHCRLR